MEGYHAYQAGAVAADNPYNSTLNRSEYTDWYLGFTDAEMEL
jgi:hypothetical protein